MRRPLLVLALALSMSSTVRAADGATPEALSLEEALGQLDAQSFTLAEARARTEQAAGLARQALAAALPVLSATGSFTLNSDEARVPLGRLLALVAPGTAAGASDLVVQPLRVFAVSGGVRVPLLAPSAWAEVASARSTGRAAIAAAEAVRQQLRASLVTAAWNARASEEVVAATTRAVGVAEEQARSAQRSLSAGTGVPLTVLQAQTEVVRRQSDLTRAVADRGRAQLAVGVLMGRPSPVRVDLTPSEVPPGLDAGALTAEALDRRPELRAAAAQAEAAERGLAAAHLRLVPQLAATGQVFAQDAPLVTGKETGWRAGLELSWTLYDGGWRYGRARQEEGALAEARAAAARVRVAAAQEVEDAVREVGTASERLRLSHEQGRLAAAAAALARRSFAAGVASSLDVLDANDRLYAAEVGQAFARAGLGAALAALDRAVGRG